MRKKNNNNIKAVIFDLDDTLFPEKEFVFSGFSKASEYISNKYKFKKEKVFKTLKKDFENEIRKKSFDNLLKKLKLPKRELSRLISIYRFHKPKIKTYLEVKKTLSFLKKNKIKLAIISDGIKKTQKNKIDALGIKKYFPITIINEKKGEMKPSPQSFKRVIKKLNIKPEQAIYIADNPEKDFIGAKKANLLTIQIKRTDGIYNKIKITFENKPHFIIENLLEIKKYV